MSMIPPKSKRTLKRKEDLTGQVFTRLTVLREVEKRGKEVNSRWLCECVCGNQREVLAHNLKQGKTHSCGCYRSEWGSATVDHARMTYIAKKEYERLEEAKQARMREFREKNSK